MKATLLSTLAVILALAGNAQAPSTGLVNIFDGINVPYGTPVGNVTVAEDRNGMYCAVQFDGEPTTLLLVQGVEQYNFHPDSSLSISLWYQGGSEDAGDLETLFAKHGAGTNPVWNPSYALELYDLNTPLMASPTASAWVDQEYITFGGDTAWHHVVGVFEVGAWKIYFDNALRGESSGPNTHVAQMSGDISIGENFEGKLDDIFLYNRALSAEEVTLLFNDNSLCAVGLVEWEAIDVVVFPNPSAALLTIDLKEIKADAMEVIDAQGRIVLTTPLLSSQEQIDVESIADGRYILRFLDNNDVIGQHPFMKAN